MKLTILLLTAAFFNAHAISVAQRVTISGKDLSFKQVFAAIKKQTGYVVFANESDLHQTKRISLSVFDMPLKDLLDIILKDQSVNYSFKGETIILSKKSPAVPQSPVVSSDLPGGLLASHPLLFAEGL